MSMRSLLGTCLVGASALAAAPVPAQDRMAGGATAVSSRVDGCIGYIAQQATVLPCALSESRIMSDHGATAAELYDTQGNPVDRNGDVIASPGDGRAHEREVFANEARLPR